MLMLPIKKKWFDMELSGEKSEEYREIKPYWTTRIRNWIGSICISMRPDMFAFMMENGYFNQPREVTFRNGYCKDAPYFVASCTISIGTGKEEWGAERNRKYYVFKIHDIIRRSTKARQEEKDAE